MKKETEKMIKKLFPGDAFTQDLVKRLDERCLETGADGEIFVSNLLAYVNSYAAKNDPNTLISDSNFQEMLMDVIQFLHKELIDYDKYKHGGKFSQGIL